MGEERRFDIVLDGDMAAIVDDAVTSGSYATSDDVVREALALWHQHRVDDPANIARLRKAWIDGLASGAPMLATDDWFEDVKQRGHARLEAWRAAG